MRASNDRLRPRVAGGEGGFHLSIRIAPGENGTIDLLTCLAN